MCIVYYINISDAIGLIIAFSGLPVALFKFQCCNIPASGRYCYEGNMPRLWKHLRNVLTFVNFQQSSEMAIRAEIPLQETADVRNKWCDEGCLVVKKPTLNGGFTTSCKILNLCRLIMWTSLRFMWTSLWSPFLLDMTAMCCDWLISTCLRTYGQNAFVQPQLTLQYGVITTDLTISRSQPWYLSLVKIISRQSRYVGVTKEESNLAATKLMQCVWLTEI